jgi:hypothetical protein
MCWNAHFLPFPTPLTIHRHCNACRLTHKVSLFLGDNTPDFHVEYLFNTSKCDVCWWRYIREGSWSVHLIMLSLPQVLVMSYNAKHALIFHISMMRGSTFVSSIVIWIGYQCGLCDLYRLQPRLMQMAGCPSTCVGVAIIWIRVVYSRVYTMQVGLRDVSAGDVRAQIT